MLCKINTKIYVNVYIYIIYLFYTTSSDNITNIYLKCKMSLR